MDDESPVRRGATLVFPAGLPAARRYRDREAAKGHRLVGASSLAFDPTERAYEEWARLPYVHEPDFGPRLKELILERGITAIHSPHEVAGRVLADLLPDIAPQVRLIGANPMAQAAGEYRRQIAAAEAFGEAPPAWPGPAARPPMPATKRAGIIRLVDAIPGMTDLDKIDALFETFRVVPQGDVVEIGSWWGRSAALLLLLSRHHSIGPVLCVDPWRAEELAQGVDVLDSASAAMDTDEAFRIFQANLSPLAAGDVNHLRATAADAARSYRPGLAIENETFGRTSYGGRIALLHIDGNHAHRHVEEDARLWTPHVVPGGWIVFDDYVWAFGDGPRRVADAFLAAAGARVDVAFVTGTALFARMTP